MAALESAFGLAVIGVLISVIFWQDWRFWDQELGWRWWLLMWAIGVPSILARNRDEGHIRAYSK